MVEKKIKGKYFKGVFLYNGNLIIEITNTMTYKVKKVFLRKIDVASKNN